MSLEKIFELIIKYWPFFVLVFIFIGMLVAQFTGVFTKDQLDSFKLIGMNKGIKVLG
jgi:hypothetical protein